MKFLPEIVLICMMVFFFFSSLFTKEKKNSGMAALLFVVLASVAAFLSIGESGEFFSGVYKIDLYSQRFKLIILISFGLVLFLGSGLKSIKDEIASEYLFFLSLSTFGLVSLVSSMELLTMLLSLELSSFSLYIAIPFRKDNVSGNHYEAGMKYLLFGALSTGITLFGMSYVFGLAHTTDLNQLFAVFPSVISSSPLGLIGFVLMLTGFFFKLAMFPMHFWTPDIYEGSANETASYIATLPKIAAVALIVRLVAISGADSGKLIFILTVFSAVSMTIGNLSALVQEDIKRLIAYSTIAHAGYIMIGILSADSQGFSSAIYYIVGYVLMNVALFFVIYNLSENGENLSFDSLKGLYKKSPVLSFTLAVAAFGMAGIPPTIGFTTKFMVFTSAIAKGYYAIVIIGVINAGISAFYYLKLVRAAYTMEDVKADEKKMKLGFVNFAFAVIINAGIILFGIYPSSIFNMAVNAVKHIFI